MSSPDILKQKSLDTYRTLINIDHQALIYYPTLFDFVAYHTIHLRSQLSSFHNIFSIQLLSPRLTFSVTPIYAPSSPQGQEILNTYAQLLSFHADDIAPLINAEIQRIEFIQSGIYHNMQQKANDTVHSLLLDLYHQYSHCQYSGDILLALGKDFPNNLTWRKEYYGYLQSFCKQFPNFARLGCIKNNITNISSPEVSISSPLRISPNNPFNIDITSTNAKKITINLYRLDDSINHFEEYTTPSEIKSKSTLIDSRIVDFSENIPFEATSKISFSVPTYGCYVAIPSAVNTKGIDNPQKIYCTDLILGHQHFKNENRLIVANALNGCPISDVDIFSSQKRKQKQQIISLSPIGSTNTDGFFDLQLDNYSYIYAHKSNSRFSTPIYIWKNEYHESDWVTNANIFTDLAIYRPGDIISWNAVVYSVKANQYKLIANSSVSVVLQNANLSPIDTLTLVTDDFGRINGQFTIPSDELTGNYSLRLFSKQNNHIAYHSVMVSDYKLPSFFIEITGVMKSAPSTDDVTLRGRVLSYSGMPIDNASLNLSLSVAQRPWWRMSNSVDFYSHTDSTDAAGCFNIIIPKHVFDNSPAPDGLFKANISATSITGESHSTSHSFTLGNTLELMVNLPSDNIDTSSPLLIPIKVTDGEGKKQTADINYIILQGDSVVFSSTFSSSNPSVDWSNVPSGNYNIKFLLDSNPTDSVICSDICLYRPSDKLPPVTSPVWTPYNTHSNPLITSATHKVSLLYGTSIPESHLLYTLVADSRIIEQRWIKTSAGLHHLDITLPKDIDKAIAQLSAISNFESKTVNVLIKTPASFKKIDIIAESFRNKIIPGTEETWTFRTIDDDSTGVASAMILNMYNGALDALRTNPFAFTPVFLDSPQLYTNISANPTIYSYLLSNQLKRFSCNDILTPDFNFYHKSFFYHKHDYILLESAMSNSVNIRGRSKLYANNTLATQATAEEVAFDSVEEETTPAITHDYQPSFEYRDSETPSAFYQPTLNTDSLGRLSFSYRVPNANTTWRFKAVAYTKDLLTAMYSADVLANKPIMVQPNLPRFLRSADVATISAAVINNSDSVQTVNTRFEIFNPATNEIISQSDSITTIAAGTSQSVAINITAPSDMPFIGFRIKSSTNIFADGEQSLIPILPITAPVIETQPFYISPDSTSYDMTIMPVPTDARVTLQFCNNPIWYAVTALPGLNSQQLSTPNDAANVIFSTAIAQGLMRDYPAINKALSYWCESDRSDSSLVSMLERNADLKTMLLQATPWMMDARSDTERMQRLALLFDKNEINASLSRAIALLKKLNRDGGWAWINHSSEASQWATHQALYTLGYLNRLGYLPADNELSNMISNALSWHQQQVINDYRRYPKASYYSFLQLRDLWQNYRPSASGKIIIDSEIQKLVRNWKKFSVAKKAQAATLLFNNGYPTLSHSILSSLRQYAESSPQKGMWWPSLDDQFGGELMQLGISADALLAFNTIEPKSPEIEQIRQWLILQKEAQNWGNGSMTSQIIATIITTSPKWLAESQPVNISINGKDIHSNYSDKLIGYICTDISSMIPSGASLQITKSDSTPAWGAVYSQSNRVITDVKASSSPDISIEKRLFKKVGNDWVDASDLHIGDRVKVQLLIHVQRNMQYMAINDDRAACFEPVEQLPHPLFAEGLVFYRENRNSSTNIFVSNMPKGTYLLEYELWVNNAGTFSSGIATIQSQYAPQLSAHSAGSTITISQ